MTVNGEGPYHPTFLYESVLNALGFLIILLLAKKFKFEGFRAACYLIWYGLVRFMIEGLRTDSLYLPGTEIVGSQALSGVMFVGNYNYGNFNQKRKK